MRGDRYQFLDGLRGVAALSVLNFHFLSAFRPRLIPEYASVPLAVSDTPVALAYNGGFAVSIFFVLSGFVLANSAAKRHLPPIFNVAQRYVRLAVPVLASTIFAFLMLWAFAGTPTILRTLVTSKWLTFVYDEDLPDLAGAVRGGFRDLFSGASMFNNALWTMKIELLGSWLVYLVYAVDRRLVHIALGAILVATSAVGLFEYGAFAAGALLRELVVAGRLPRALPWAALCIGVVIGAMMPGYDLRVLDLKQPMLPEALRLGTPHKLFDVVAACLVIYGFLALPAVQKIFSLRPLRLLGEVSFGLYLVHVPLIYSVVGSVYFLLDPYGPVTIVIVYAMFLILTLGFGYVFTMAIDRPVLHAIRLAQRRYRSRHMPDQRSSAIGGVLHGALATPERAGSYPSVPE